jgi:RNA polymerase sigma-B factor
LRSAFGGNLAPDHIVSAWRRYDRYWPIRSDDGGKLMSTAATQFVKDSTSPPGARRAPVSDREIAALFVRWQRDGDRAARDMLVERYLPLARNLARRYARSSEPFEDLMQVASLGLVKALDRFDTTRGYRFAAFAVPTILGELRRYFRDAAWAVHVPRGAQERALDVEEAQEQLTGRTGHPPTVQEIAEYLELRTDEVLASLQVGQAYSTLSLDAPRRTTDDDQEPYGDSLGAEDERFELVEADVVVTEALRQLPLRERRILQLRFVEDMTQSEIAEKVGLSQMQISRLLRRSLEQLRKIADAEPPEPSGQSPATAR